jgi:hypothetical protein
MFDTILAKRFEQLPGQNKVRRKEYALEDHQSGQELNASKQWSLCFRPGQKVDMSMIFRQNQASTSCPGCKTESHLADISTIEW